MPPAACRYSKGIKHHTLIRLWTSCQQWAVSGKHYTVFDVNIYCIFSFYHLFCMCKEKSYTWSHQTFSYSYPYLPTFAILKSCCSSKQSDNFYITCLYCNCCSDDKMFRDAVFVCDFCVWVLSTPNMGMNITASSCISNFKLVVL